MKKMIQNHLTEKFEKIKDSLDRISKNKASSYLKQTVINLYDTEFTKKRISLLNLGRNSVLTTTTMCLKLRNSSLKRKKQQIIQHYSSSLEIKKYYQIRKENKFIDYENSQLNPLDTIS